MNFTGLEAVVATCGRLDPALSGMNSSVLLCQLGEKPVRSA